MAKATNLTQAIDRTRAEQESRMLEQGLTPEQILHILGDPTAILIDAAEMDLGNAQDEGRDNKPYKRMTAGHRFIIVGCDCKDAKKSSGKPQDYAGTNHIGSILTVDNSNAGGHGHGMKKGFLTIPSKTQTTGLTKSGYTVSVPYSAFFETHTFVDLGNCTRELLEIGKIISDRFKADPDRFETVEGSENRIFIDPTTDYTTVENYTGPLTEHGPNKAQREHQQKRQNRKTEEATK